jgi:AraC-like DNA-binding protein
MKGMVINIVNSYTFHRIFDKIKKTVEEKGVFGEVEISSLLIQLLSELMRSEAPVWIQPVMDFINNNYKSKITIDQLAELTHINKYHFIKKFKKEIGYSPYQYIINQRIDEAKYYLTHMDYSIGEIAEKTGFESASNFSQQFSKIYHMSPQCFRKRSKI